MVAKGETPDARNRAGVSADMLGPTGFDLAILGFAVPLTRLSSLASRPHNNDPEPDASCLSGTRLRVFDKENLLLQTSNTDDTRRNGPAPAGGGAGVASAFDFLSFADSQKSSLWLADPQAPLAPSCRPRSTIASRDVDLAVSTIMESAARRRSITTSDDDDAPSHVLQRQLSRQLSVSKDVAVDVARRMQRSGGCLPALGASLEAPLPLVLEPRSTTTLSPPDSSGMPAPPGTMASLTGLGSSTAANPSKATLTHDAAWRIVELPRGPTGYGFTVSILHVQSQMGEVSGTASPVDAGSAVASLAIPSFNPSLDTMPPVELRLNLPASDSALPCSSQTESRPSEPLTPSEDLLQGTVTRDEPILGRHRALAVNSASSNAGSSTTTTKDLHHQSIIDVVEPHGDAERAGLRPGDLVLGINAHSMADKTVEMVHNLLHTLQGSISLCSRPVNSHAREPSKDQSLQGSTAQNSFFTPEPSVADPVSREGPLDRKDILLSGGKKLRNRAWKSLHCVLRGHMLCFYTSSDSHTAALVDRISCKGSLSDIAYDYVKRKHVFRLVSSDGAEFLLQTVSEEAMLAWIHAIKAHTHVDTEMALEAHHALIKSRTDTVRALKTSSEAMPLGPTSFQFGATLSPALATLRMRLSTRHGPRPRKSDGSPSLPSSTHPIGNAGRSVFEMPLEEICSEYRMPVSPVLLKCVATVDNRGLEFQGIYRQVGSHSASQRLREACIQNLAGLNLNDEERWSDMHSICGIVKSYIRDLPEPILLRRAYPEWIQACRTAATQPLRLQLYKDLIDRLPSAHYNTLQFLLAHLSRVAEHSEVNKMATRNLALVFGPTMIKPGLDSIASMMTDMREQVSIMETLIVHHEELFASPTSPRVLASPTASDFAAASGPSTPTTVPLAESSLLDAELQARMQEPRQERLPLAALAVFDSAGLCEELASTCFGADALTLEEEEEGEGEGPAGKDRKVQEADDDEVGDGDEAEEEAEDLTPSWEGGVVTETMVETQGSTTKHPRLSDGVDLTRESQRNRVTNGQSDDHQGGTGAIHPGDRQPQAAKAYPAQELGPVALASTAEPTSTASISGLDAQSRQRPMHVGDATGPTRSELSTSAADPGQPAAQSATTPVDVQPGSTVLLGKETHAVLPRTSLVAPIVVSGEMTLLTTLWSDSIAQPSNVRGRSASITAETPLMTVTAGAPLRQRANAVISSSASQATTLAHRQGAALPQEHMLVENVKQDVAAPLSSGLSHSLARGANDVDVSAGQEKRRRARASLDSQLPHDGQSHLPDRLHGGQASTSVTSALPMASDRARAGATSSRAGLGASQRADGRALSAVPIPPDILRILECMPGPETAI